MKQKHELAQEDYMQGMKYKDIAEKHDVSVNTVKSWKTRYKWNRKGVHTNNEKVRAQKKTGAPINNKNAVGNSGNKNPKWGNKNAVGHGPPKGNDNAVTHGLFRKYLPKEVYELKEELTEVFTDPLSILWENIMLQYSQIIHAQRIMFVSDKDDITREIKKETDMGTEYEIQMAWDKQANFLNAQSRAMGTLSSLIKQFDELANKDDERRAKLNLMNAQIDKLKADINKEDKDVLRVQIVDDVPQDDDDV
ncbi:phage terminase small subunit [Bacillus cereus]|nr:phage terminase small subunit [Bacillus cereus]